jgi:hypothetical protein
MAGTMEGGKLRKTGGAFARPLLTLVMAAGYLLGTLSVAGLFMTAGSSTAQARRRGGHHGRSFHRHRGIHRHRGFRRRRGGDYFFLGVPFLFGAPYYYGSCGYESRRCSRRYGWGPAYRHCMWSRGC